MRGLGHASYLVGDADAGLAAVVDPRSSFVYLTEDDYDCRFYRFRPDRPGDLSAGPLEAAAGASDEDLRLSPDLDYAAVGGLSNEVREKLVAARPVTLGQAGRIEGVTPGALTALLAHVKKAKRSA